MRKTHITYLRNQLDIVSRPKGVQHIKFITSVLFAPQRPLRYNKSFPVWLDKKWVSSDQPELISDPAG